MRWVFLLLVMLNGFYYLWHQQQAPLRPKEVAPLAQFKGNRQDIRLLSESGVSSSGNLQCLYLGGDMQPNQARTIEQRLTSLDIQTQFGKRVDEAGAVYWLKVEPESRRLIDDAMLLSLTQDFPQLKSKIMSCEGVATAG
ncbi:hypothetical protein NPS29_21420 [Pseudomonas putida]|uniref:hypothetical protein n=1 Tax=Pseudomonas putida TaxID=303 RepID=UPI002363C700|nr:hypothetical protein [Pseudomonas putida]MDD1967889.1 hypothetical protein [Pseudomonas putida]